MKFVNHEVDKVELIYHHFKSAGSQILTRKTFLPIDLSTEEALVDNDRDLSTNVTTARVQEYIRKKKEAKESEAIEAVPSMMTSLWSQTWKPCFTHSSQSNSI